MLRHFVPARPTTFAARRGAKRVAGAGVGFDPVRLALGRQNVAYLDYQATTPTDPRVVSKMMPYFTHAFGNPHSRTHAYGWESEAAVEHARARLARLINAADPRDIVFTSGATESNNLAIKGVARFYRGSGKSHIITVQTEHKCVLDSCRALQEEGFTVTYLPVDADGLVNPLHVDQAIRQDATTALVSVMTVNNEIGVIQRVHEIGEICRRRAVFFHTDAAQAVGKIKIDVQAMGCHLMSISGHKIYGPKGIGALYACRRPRVRLEPLFSGGMQERGLRSGTVPTPLVVGLGEAADICLREMDADAARIQSLSRRLVSRITSELSHVLVNGSREHGYPGCINLSFACVEGESLLMGLKQFALSSGSACTSASLEPSYVLRALASGRSNANKDTNEDDVMAHSSIRFGIGRFTTEAEIDAVAQSVIECVTKLREMSPLWEMLQDGIDLNSINWSGGHHH